MAVPLSFEPQLFSIIHVLIRVIPGAEEDVYNLLMDAYIGPLTSTTDQG